MTSVAQINVQHLSTQKNQFFILIQFDFSLRDKVVSIFFFLRICWQSKYSKKNKNNLQIVYACFKEFLFWNFDRFIELKRKILILWDCLFSFAYTCEYTHTPTHAPTHTHTRTQWNILPCNSNLLIYLFSLPLLVFLLSISNHMTNHETTTINPQSDYFYLLLRPHADPPKQNFNWTIKIDKHYVYIAFYFRFV